MTTSTKTHNIPGFGDVSFDYTDSGRKSACRHMVCFTLSVGTGDDWRGVSSVAFGPTKADAERNAFADIILRHFDYIGDAVVLDKVSGCYRKGA